MSVGLIPMVDRNLCNSCGRCAADCPADAISTADPTLTIKDRCISCGRCITHCPRNARKHGGLKYKLIDFIFTRAFSKKREAEYTVL